MENSKKQVINEQTTVAELEKLLGFQGYLRIPRTAWEHAKRCTSLFELVCDLYNYGYIMGQRAERQRVRYRGGVPPQTSTVALQHVNANFSR